MNIPLHNARSDAGAQPASKASEKASFWRPKVSAIRLRIIASFMLIDLVSIIVGFSVAIQTRIVIYGETNWEYFLLALVPVYFAVAINAHAYTGENLRAPAIAIRRGLRALLLAMVMLVFLGFALKASDQFPRTVTFSGTVLAGTLMVIGRRYFVLHFERIVGGNPFNVLLIRDHDQPIPPGDFSAVLLADDDLDPERHDPVMYNRLALAFQGAHRVVVACRPDRRTAWAHVLKGAGIQGEIVVPELTELAPLDLDRHGDTWTMIVANGPLGLSDRALKRGFDLAVALLMLALLSPLLIVVAIAVKLDSRGPVLFRQERIGRGNEIFQILKFRSMCALRSDHTGDRSASRDDDRITRVGRFIRATSIDELPQLLNVLKGDMSIVGPRPHALGSRAADKLFWEIDARYWHRHAAKPGLTGLAQVRGFRGATLVEADLANRLQADLEYLEDWSLWRDVKLVLLTLRVVLHRNAF